MKPTAMRTTRRARLAVGAMLAVALTAPLLAGCLPTPLAEPVVRTFLLAWQSQNYRAAARQTTGDPTAVAAALADAYQQLDAAALHLEMGPVRQRGDTAQARFEVDFDLGEGQPPWEYTGRMSLVRRHGEWKIAWSPSVIHPRLQPGERLAVVTDMPHRAPIVDAAGRPLVRDEKLIVIGARPANLADPVRTARELAEATGLDAERLLGQLRSAPPTRFSPLVALRWADFRAKLPRLRAIHGLSVRITPAPLTPVAARALLGEVGTANSDTLRGVGAPYQPGDTVGLSGLQMVYQRQLSGSPDSKVITIDSQGHEVATLAEWQGTKGIELRTTLDSRVQLAADRALARLRVPGAALVAIRASTGEVLAVADQPPSPGAERALHRGYPPGEAFTIVSSAALLRAGLQIGTAIPCVPERRVGGQVFRSPPQAGSQAPPFLTDFAHGCRTAFAGLARRLPLATLSQVIDEFGLGGNWRLPVPTFSGVVPDHGDDATKAAVMLGEGGVRVSPLAMALVAAAVDSGTWHPPSLVQNPASSARPAPDPTALDPQLTHDLRTLMREAVRVGGGRVADLRGEPVYAQVGMVPDGRARVVGWFVGYRGDLAFATMVEMPATSRDNLAVQAGADFLRALS